MSKKLNDQLDVDFVSITPTNVKVMKEDRLIITDLATSVSEIKLQ